jgi:hypothetical protein
VHPIEGSDSLLEGEIERWHTPRPHSSSGAWFCFTAAALTLIGASLLAVALAPPAHSAPDTFAADRHGSEVQLVVGVLIKGHWYAEPYEASFTVYKGAVSVTNPQAYTGTGEWRSFSSPEEILAPLRHPGQDHRLSSEHTVHSLLERP